MAKILIVDDHPINRKLLVVLLGYVGHELLEAGDGREALELVREKHPDLVITDIVMPTMDGFEFAKRLRDDPSPSIAKTPVIFYTATYRVRNAEALAQGCGVSVVVPKPSRPEVILAEVNRALGTSVPVAAGRRRRGHEPASLATGGPGLPENLSNYLTDVDLRFGFLVDLGLHLASERDPGRLLQMVCRAAQDVISAGQAVLCIVNEKGVVRHFHRHGIDADRPLDSALWPPVLERLVPSWSPVRLLNPTRDGNPAALGLPAALGPVRSLLAVPLVGRRADRGWLCLTNRIAPGGFTVDDEKVAVTLAAQAVLAFESLTMARELEEKVVSLSGR